MEKKEIVELTDIEKIEIDEQETPIEMISFSHVDEDGVYKEAYGYCRKNKAKEFFKSLSQEQLDNIKKR